MNEFTLPLLLIGGPLAFAVAVGLPIWCKLGGQWQRDAFGRRWLGAASLSLGMALAPLVLVLLPPPLQAQPAEVEEHERTQPRPLSVPLLSEPEPTLDELGSDSEVDASQPADIPPADSKAVEGSAAEPTSEAATDSSHGLEELTKRRPDLPVWVESRSVREGSLHRQAVHSDYHATERDSWRALDDELRLATTEYIAEYLNDSNAPLLVDYSLQEIKTRLLKPENVHHEIREFGFGIMHQTHALLEFPPEFRQELDRRWHQVTHAGRVIMTGGVFLGVVLLLCLFLGYLRIEQRTRGSFSARLPFVAAAAILALILAGTLWTGSHATWIQWLLSQDLL